MFLRYLRVGYFTLLTAGLFLGVISNCIAADISAKKNKTEGSEVAAYTKALKRSFDQLDFTFPDPVLQSNSFTHEGILPETITDSVDYHLGRSSTLLNAVYTDQRFVDNLTLESLLVLPVGIKKSVGGIDFVIVVDRLKLYPDHVELSAYLVFTLPQNGKELAFYARNIRFSSSGGITGEGRLELLGSHDINVFGQHTKFSLIGSTLGPADIGGGTYATFDCTGFKELGINGELIFSKSLLKPEGAEGEILDEPMSIGVSTIVSDWNDLVLEVNMPTFQVTGLDGVGFSVTRAVFDFSDTRNAPGITFPAGYRNDGQNGLWRGVYIYDFSVRLPKQFEDQSSAERVSFSANNVFIDNMGFSGKLVARNLLTLENGRLAEDWAFSLQELGVELEANQLKSAGFSGQLVSPVFDESSPLNYGAIIRSGNEYQFTVGLGGDLEMNLWKAEVTLVEGSYIEIETIEDKFDIRAVLNGSMTVKAPMGNSDSSPQLSLADLRFQDLVIQSAEPRVSFGAIALSSEKVESAMAGLPVSISEIRVSSRGPSIGLGVTLALHLSGTDEGGFTGEGAVDVFGTRVPKGDRNVYEFDHIELRAFAVDMDMGAVSMKGTLDFFREDPVYGNGILGTLDAQMMGLDVRAKAQFGKVDGFRYWYGDAMVIIPGPGLPLIPPFMVNGFGGGAYSHMSQFAGDLLTESTAGVTNTGLVYKPDRDTSFGIKASIAFLLGAESAFNGEATLDVSFHRKGGIRKASFSGIGYMLTAPENINLEKLKEKASKVPGRSNEVNTGVPVTTRDAAIIGSVYLLYDAENKVLHGNTRVYANIAGGVIRGVGPNGLVGEIVIHFDSEEWYILVGTPDQRVGLELLGFAKTESYLMIGNPIPGSPPPDQVLGKILGDIDLDYMRDENSLESGFGFAFGSKLSISTGDLTFLIFYAKFNVGVGFDIMLKDYGSATCANRSGNLGMNGWYANGQVYAYIQGEIGLTVKMFGRRRKFSILAIELGALLQAKLPNPTWMRGAVGGSYRILGGLIKGQANFEFTLGEECEIVAGGSVLEGVSVISRITPNEGSSDVSVFSTPQAVFNLAINRPFKMVDVDNVEKEYRAMLESFEILDGTTPIQATHEWNQENTVVILNTHEILPPEKIIKVSAKIRFEEMKNGDWTAVEVDGDPYRETLISSFMTGEAPDHIPYENVAYTYPVINQMNFYPDEYDKGYIMLKKGQSYLFNLSAEFETKARFQAVNGSSLYVDFQYNTSKKQVDFSLPAGLSNEQLYAMELVSRSKNQVSSIDQNVTSSTASVSLGDGSSTEITTRSAEGAIEGSGEQITFRSYFRTSAYKTFTEKMRNISYSSTNLWLIDIAVHRMSQQITGNELFDQAEIGAWLSSDNLVVIESDLSQSTWYNSDIYPLMYQGYPWQSDMTLDRHHELEKWGMPPVRTTFVDTYYQDPILDGSMTSQPIVPPNATSGIIANFIALGTYEDYINLTNKSANTIGINAVNRSRMANLLTSRFPGLRNGYYPVTVKYKLPGINQITSTHPITFGFNAD